MLSINLEDKNRTRGRWDRSENAIHCAMRPLLSFFTLMAPWKDFDTLVIWLLETKRAEYSLMKTEVDKMEMPTMKVMISRIASRRFHGFQEIFFSLESFLISVATSNYQPIFNYFDGYVATQLNLSSFVCFEWNWLRSRQLYRYWGLPYDTRK